MEDIVSIHNVDEGIKFNKSVPHPWACKSAYVEYVFKAEGDIPSGLPFKLEISDAYDLDFALINSVGSKVKSVRFGCRRNLAEGERFEKKFQFVFKEDCDQLSAGTPFHVELYHGSKSQGYDFNDEKTHFVLK